jgi:hypothetical protein
MDRVQKPSNSEYFDYNLLGFETWSLTLMEEHGLRVYENKVVRRTFGKRAKEMTGGWIKLHNAEYN